MQCKSQKTSSNISNVDINDQIDKLVETHENGVWFEKFTSKKH